MEKTTRYAEIPQLKGGVAFTDPMYDDSAWCQYRKEFHPSSGWVMKMESTRDEDGYADFSLLIGRRSTLSGLRLDEEAGAIYHFAHHVLDEKSIGADTARVYVGSLDRFREWGEEASIYTAADGLFGNLYIATCKGEDEPAGFVLMGAIDTAVTDEDELFRTVTAAFDGHEIDRERFEKITDSNSLEVKKEIAKELLHARALEQDGKSKPPKGKVDPER